MADRVEVDALQGLVISGGDDIHPTLFDEQPIPDTFYDRERDALEQDYIIAGMERELPILGICRGFQLINVTLGGALHLDIRNMRSKTRNRRSLVATKTVSISAGSRLCHIVGRRRLRVNSLHFQAVSKLSEDLVCEAQDLDAFCQAASLPGKNVLGVQWHPEYLFYLPTQLRLFRWLIQEAVAVQARMSRST